MAKKEILAAAHRAGRERGENVAVARAAGRLTTGILERVHLSVQDDTPLLPPPVVATAENLPVVHEHRADGDTSLGQPALRFVDRRAQEFLHQALLSVAAPNVLPPGAAHRSWDGSGHDAPADEQVYPPGDDDSDQPAQVGAAEQRGRDGTLQ